MSLQVEWGRRALKAVSRLDRPTQERILTAIDDLAQQSRGDVRRLEGVNPASYRLRVGNWRVIFSYLDPATILILRVRPRGDAYKQ